MPAPKVLILRAAGINCDLETAKAFEVAGADPRPVHLNRVLEKPTLLKDFGCIAIPGGFSYGDDVAAGKILALELSIALGDALRAFVDRGGLVLGVCNGFQVLVKTGLLPGPIKGRKIGATLAWNDSHRYEDRWVRLRADATRSVFIEKHDAILELPVAHGEGKFLVDPPEALDDVVAEGRAPLRYAAADGGVANYPDNPNGSPKGVAAVCDETGRVLGLMPHPERFLYAYQHPRWTREPRRAEGDGLSFFRAAVKAMS